METVGSCLTSPFLVSDSCSDFNYYSFLRVNEGFGAVLAVWFETEEMLLGDFIVLREALACWVRASPSFSLGDLLRPIEEGFEDEATLDYVSDLCVLAPDLVRLLYR